MRRKSIDWGRFWMGVGVTIVILGWLLIVVTLVGSIGTILAKWW